MTEKYPDVDLRLVTSRKKEGRKKTILSSSVTIRDHDDESLISACYLVSVRVLVCISSISLILLSHIAINFLFLINKV